MRTLCNYITVYVRVISTLVLYNIIIANLVASSLPW